MVLEVLADPRQVDPGLDPEPAELLGRADSRDHEDLRAADRPGAEHHLAGGAGDRLPPPAVAPADPGRPLALERDAEHLGAGDHGQVRPLHRRAQVGVGTAPATPVSLRHLGDRHPVLLGRVDVAVGGDPGGLRGIEKAAGQRARRALVGDVQRTAGAVHLGGAPLVVLGPLEQRQHVLVAPARAAPVAPAVVVERATAHVHHRVHRAGAAEDLAARHEQLAPVEARLGAGRVVPVDLGAELLREGGRDLDVG